MKVCFAIATKKKGNSINEHVLTRPLTPKPYEERVQYPTLSPPFFIWGQQTIGPVSYDPELRRLFIFLKG